MQKQSFWSPLALAGLTLWLAAAGSGESLWVDELHSSWAISDGFAEVAPRARAGNQSPLYLWLLWGVNRVFSWTPGPAEYRLRALSAVAWAACTWCLARRLAGWTQSRESSAGESDPAGGKAARQTCERWMWGLLTSAIPVSWILLDRIQLFYATEARVYALVQWLSLLNWLLVARIVGLQSNSPQGQFAGNWTSGWRSAVSWCGISVLLIYLHSTAALVVGWQWLCVAVACLMHGWRSSAGRPLTSSPSPRKRGEVSDGEFASLPAWRSVASRLTLRGRACAGWLVCAVGVGLAAVPAGLMSRDVWERRDQWQSFAGNAGWENSLSLFPVLALAIPIGIGRLVDWLGRRRRGADVIAEVKLALRGRASDRRERTQGMSESCLWLLAAAGPWLSVWLATAAGVAPLMHRRFVIASALPLVFLATRQWLKIRQPWLRLSAGVAVVGWLLVSQGSVAVWRQGDLLGWQRIEDWRGAVRFLNGTLEPGDQLWCASGLIEGEGLDVPLADAVNHYLSFPLRGLYQPRTVDGGMVEPQALVNDSRRWLQQWQLAESADVHRRRLWIVARSRPARLTQRLEAIVARSQGRLSIVRPASSFGSIAVAAMDLRAE